jgi:aminobenzoyl-glutamate utilization protein B
MALNPTQQSAVAWIEANRARLSDFNKTIWHFAEPAWREYKSSLAN